MVISDDIIRRALNESINEMIEKEELLQEGLGDSFKNAWNNVKNAAAMYMDWRTNGQWNNKYGIYANGNGKMTELYYLNKWFNFHLNEIKKIDYYLRSPRNAQSEIQWKIDPKTGEKKGTQTINNYNDIQDYVIQNINAKSFNNWIGYFVKNRAISNSIDDYINACSTSIKDINSATQWLNTGAFLSYLSNNGQQMRQNQQNANGTNLPVGKKDPNWRPTNSVTILNTKNGQQ